MGKKKKKKAREKFVGREKGKRRRPWGSPQFPPVLFPRSRFLDSADSTISEPETGYEIPGAVSNCEQRYLTDSDWVQGLQFSVCSSFTLAVTPYDNLLFLTCIYSQFK